MRVSRPRFALHPRLVGPRLEGPRLEGPRLVGSSLVGRRLVSRRALGASVLLALPSIISRSAKAARNITIAGYGDWFQAAFDPLILGAFRRAHPEIAVFYYPVGNSFQTLAMLRGQRAYPSTDVVLLDSGVAVRAAAEGLLDPLRPETLPVMKDLIPAAMSADLAGPALVLDSLALGYSPAQINPAPRLWRNLWDSAYGSRIALQTPPDPLGLAITVVAAKLFGGGDRTLSVDIGLNALTQLVPRVAVWNPVPDVYTAIATGDAAIGPVWNARAQNQAALTPGRFAAIIPEEGSPCQVTTINLVRNSPDPDAARTLIAWLLAPEAQRLLAETMFFAPVNTRTSIPASSLSRAGATPALVERRIEMDWAGVTRMRDQITAAWRSRRLAGR